MHNIRYLDYPEKCNRKEIISIICDIAEHDGDGYSGPMHWHDEVAPLESYEAAERWIKAHDKGWYDDHAVRYYDYSRLKDTKKISELKQRALEIQKKKGEYATEHSVKKLKAVLITCPKCGSKLSRAHLRSEYCPLCNTDLRSKTTQETLKHFDERISQVWKTIQAEQRKSKGEVRWLVKYEYHS